MNLADNLKKLRNNSKDYNSRIKSSEEQLQNAKDSYQEVYFLLYII